MDRQEALELLKQHLKNQNLFKHCLAVEAIMRELARELGKDEEKWGLVGLLHDIDYEKTMDKPETHGVLAEEILKGKVDEEIIHAIKSHNFEHTGVVPSTDMEKALVAADALSGLLIACALVMPDKKLASVKVKTVKKKFKQKDFARRVNRNLILVCRHLGIDEEKFFEIGLRALQKIANELGL